jgi:hypothetical protein
VASEDASSVVRDRGAEGTERTLQLCFAISKAWNCSGMSCTPVRRSHCHTCASLAHLYCRSHTCADRPSGLTHQHPSGSHGSTATQRPRHFPRAFESFHGDTVALQGGGKTSSLTVSHRLGHSDPAPLQ